MSSRTVTNKGVDKFVETLNDRRFSPHLFASYIANETENVQRHFFRMVLDYLSIMARNHQEGINYVGVTDIASSAYKMYSAYLAAGGIGEPIHPDLSRFDIPSYDIV